MSSDAAELNQFRSWIGRKDSAEDEITAWPVKAMNAGSASEAAVMAASSDASPPGPKLFGFL